MFRYVFVFFIITTAVANGANVFNMPPGQTSLEFVTIGDAANVPDTRYINTYPSRQNLLLGSVPYEYQIGKYDVTLAQYAQFLNAVAASDPFIVYRSGAPLRRFGISGTYTYSVDSGFENHPISGLTWNSTARFVNWLQNGQPTGPQGPTTTESGVYELVTVGQFTINGNDVKRNTNSTYFLPTEDEWYKAAYYKGGGANAGYWTFATQNDVAPSNVISATGTNNANYDAGVIPVGTFAGSPSYYGTYDQSGNNWNWTETYSAFDFGRVYRGGSALSNSAVELSAVYY